MTVPRLLQMRSGLNRRYGEERLPRYTSYPTAPYFSESITQHTYRQWLAGIPRDKTVSLYLHIPFCQSMCWYCGCNTTIVRRHEPVAEYLAALSQEIEMVTDHIGQRLKVGAVHFGGGTPTIMTPDQFSDLMTVLRRKFDFLPGAEIAIEIDPRRLTPEMARALGANGVTRASLGVQSFDPAVQQAVNRIQSFEDTAAVTEGLRAAGINSINFDLIYGLPHQTVASCFDTVQKCMQLRPDRFAVFGYAHIPTFKKHQRKIEETALPDGEQRHLQTNMIAHCLTNAGYRQIGLDHFALPADSLTTAQAAGHLHRNFQGYTTDDSDILIGFGASAIGRLEQGYVQNEVAPLTYRTQIGNGNLPTRKGYALSDDDRLRADIIERIMCDFHVDLQQACARHGTRPETVLRSADRLDMLIADGIVRLEGPVLSVADDTRHLVRSVAAAFDAYLGTSGPVYSRAV
ncbi:oxygen-independent coproporphyrinogen III oxidase [[Pseudomonas] carboxydohydrogena]|uniref:Coproporphyrinogen-III oxidase n=2 Tax=Afipia carboxydohydrogena TaxID=290 RepID=A0ABY8BQL3_AFICR|nr:oxygen-independent coproporphyrinogen III oxidase [[Pseudomonas] carboxydohydrogena]WEF52297.1 oxygen-independent coproporphyrinogen III oxidase [[Pseudomonas] carboxydohydrogena]